MCYQSHLQLTGTPYPTEEEESVVQEDTKLRHWRQRQLYQVILKALNNYSKGSCINSSSNTATTTINITSSKQEKEPTKFNYGGIGGTAGNNGSLARASRAAAIADTKVSFPEPSTITTPIAYNKTTTTRHDDDNEDEDEENVMVGQSTNKNCMNPFNALDDDDDDEINDNVTDNYSNNNSNTNTNTNTNGRQSLSKRNGSASGGMILPRFAPASFAVSGREGGGGSLSTTTTTTKGIITQTPPPTQSYLSGGQQQPRQQLCVFGGINEEREEIVYNDDDDDPDLLYIKKDSG
ncbi:hypothetical protein FRACYDRAFT_249360 [Fragilariopsis cylindrus CCMP1102]|uniref:Uncharacterized protein n=1 Tax=Fragilariopsis cylindrus CCMP1102 TaxID=635003 RepID=A0A1E7ET53_9STRA|nr:hypothetical protein FRACYDRAFT_249360 [Fragilariopsis cylindrus CCMP1102]|eukprot:OEU09016.1 hypothetical protein FRACYDRAFT_249360 [Fragilariopsis cylindrus CCMP1102]